jgi:hypothetical protein
MTMLMFNLHIQVVNVVPLNAEILLLVVDDHGQPDVTRFPERVRVPL